MRKRASKDLNERTRDVVHQSRVEIEKAKQLQAENTELRSTTKEKDAELEKAMDTAREGKKSIVVRRTRKQ